MLEPHYRGPWDEVVPEDFPPALKWGPAQMSAALCGTIILMCLVACPMLVTSFAADSGVFASALFFAILVLFTITGDHS